MIAGIRELFAWLAKATPAQVTEFAKRLTWDVLALLDPLFELWAHEA